MTDAIRLEKDRIREMARKLRAEVDASELGRISDEISNRVNVLPEMRNARIVHSYMPIPGGGEIDSRPIIRTLLARGVRIILPVVRTFGHAEMGLEHIEWDGASPLIPNRWGIDEPSGGSFEPLSAIDVVIVPLLAADIHGNRIGHGKGYYDAFLAGTSARTIGLAMDSVVFESIPSEPHDIPLSMIVTEARILERT